jgi:UDP-2,3-diacylglucosamine pyrophosphatase LpxH
MTVPQFQQLHVVSDLHLGGAPGFQIFNQGKRLAAFIQQLAEKEADSIGLVLNGDIVDFLAEEPGRYLDPLGAIEKLERIYHKDSAFTMVWEALEAFVARDHCRLILVLGNHDVELALPTVREWFVGKLSKGDAAARGRIVIALEGAGFACKVGTKRVLCLHGNEVDDWNRVDYRKLLEVSRSINRGETPDEWDANAGTRMVIDVMNDVKRKFPMVDLLKPEKEAAARILLFLDPSQLAKLTRSLRVMGYLSKEKLKRHMGFLSAESEGEAVQELPTEAEVARRLLYEHLGEVSAHDQTDVGVLLQRAYDAIEAGKDPKERTDWQDTEMLGIRDYLTQFISNKAKREEVLRNLLRWWLRKDESFNVRHQDDTFKELDKLVGPEVDYLVAGHTHLERAIERRHAGRYYFNSGTWIRLIQLPDEVLDDPKAFSRVYEAFSGGSMQALDLLAGLGPAKSHQFVQNISTVVSIVKENGYTCGQLAHARDDGSLQTLDNTSFPRVGI